METQEKSFIRDKNLKVNCECGGCYTMQNKIKHIKSDKHQKHLKPDEDNIHKVQCICGGRYTVSALDHHNKTKRHREYMRINFPNDTWINPNNSKLVELIRMQDKKYRKARHREMEASNREKKSQLVSTCSHSENLKATNIEHAKMKCKENILKQYNLDITDKVIFDEKSDKIVIEKEDYTITLNISFKDIVEIK